jgi:lipopolysaccharide/colanic/teichoic acid biosynthesis glycosyltransferase
MKEELNKIERLHDIFFKIIICIGFLPITIYVLIKNKLQRKGLK